MIKKTFTTPPRVELSKQETIEATQLKNRIKRLKRIAFTSETPHATLARQMTAKRSLSKKMSLIKPYINGAFL